MSLNLGVYYYFFLFRKSKIMVADKLIEIDVACTELSTAMNQFKLVNLEKLKTDILLSASPMYRDYIK